MRTLAMVLLVLGVGACSGKSAAPGAPMADTAAVGVAAAKQGEAAPAPGQPRGAAAIAYSYKLGFELPSDRLDDVQRAHRAACEALGPAHCQLLGSSRHGEGGAGESSLDLRIDPAAIKAFEARLESSATGAGGKLLFDDVEGEDLTRQLIDADAALTAKRTLRDRLQTLLETRQGHLADLLAVEKALSETQQELDTATAELAALRQRVDFAKLSVVYRSANALGSTERPLAEAWARAGTTLSASLALLLTAGVALLPWLLPVGLLVWAGSRWRAARARRAARRAIPPA